MKTVAKMKFHFWGNYSAEIYVVSDTQEQADKIHSMLEFTPECPVYDACGNARETNGWVKQVNKEHNKYAVIGWFAGKDLEKATAQIKAIKGGERIDSMERSIDSGPLCELSL